MGPFIPNLSHHTAPLRVILKKNAEFEWSANQQPAFNKIKELICQETTLSYFNPEKETVVQVDACTYRPGAALLQDGKPIAFASKSLTETESRYANIEVELLAVVFGAQRFHTYIYGKHFMVESDHKPLEMISNENLTAAPPRLLTMLLKLQGYDMTIKYRPGREMILADSLSRAPNKRNASTINLDNKIALVQFSNEKISTLQHATKEDGILSQLFDIIVTGWPEKQRDLPRDLRPYWSYRDELSVENGIILKGDRIVIPESMQPDILKQIHAGHQGITKCQSRAKSRGAAWPEVLPGLLEVLPGLLEVLPGLLEVLPGLLEVLPGLLEVLPGLLEVLPGLLEVLPGLLEVLPGLFEVLPGLLEVLPGLLEVLPGLLEVLPGLLEVLPGLLEVLPGLLEVLPGLLEVLPGLLEVLPGLLEVLPGLLEVLPGS